MPLCAAQTRSAAAQAAPSGLKAPCASSDGADHGGVHDECLELATAARAAGLRAELRVGDEARTWRADVPVYDWQDRPFMALGGAGDARMRTDRYAVAVWRCAG